MNEEVVIYLIDCSQGPTPADGCYVQEYDATKPSIGNDATCLFRWTKDRSQAKRYPTLGEAITASRQTTGRTRPDGKPDRPLTAFTCEYLRDDQEPLFK